jgi:hypothetical protein
LFFGDSLLEEEEELEMGETGVEEFVDETLEDGEIEVVEQLSMKGRVRHAIPKICECFITYL